MRRGTYSIVARDAASGEIGVAVQSHWFSVGSIVSWARPGVGAVATQSIAEPAYGPRLLDALAAGEPPRAALDALLAGDDQAAYRQVAVVDARGEAVAHTGERCIAFAGDAGGAGFTTQANMMARRRCGLRWRGPTGTRGPLARRLYAALLAAEGAGGDVRGRQSAALLVVPATGEAWQTTRDLRVEDHADPLGELGRLLDLADAYDLANEGDELAGAGDHVAAGERYRPRRRWPPGTPS